MSHFRRTRIRAVAVLAAASAVILFAAAATLWAWNARQRPSSISGAWLLDDLRTQGDDASLVTFSGSGVFDGDREFATRWRYREGRLYLRTWKIDPHSPVMNAMQDTALYSWFTDAQEFSLGVELSKDGNVMTLSAEGEGPRCRLRRVAR